MKTIHNMLLALIPSASACFALSPQARATCKDACLTNQNTVQGVTVAGGVGVVIDANG